MRVRQTFYLAIATMASSLFFAGCGGSSDLSNPTPAGTTAPASPVLPSESAFSATSVIRPAASTGATSLQLPLPGTASYAGHATFPVSSIPQNLVLTLTYSNHAPSGIAPLAIARRETAAVSRSASTSARLQPLQENSTDTVYGCFAANYLVTLNGAPQFRFVLPPNFAQSGVDYYLALLQSGQWASNFGGPGTVLASSTGTTVSVTGRFALTIPANGQICAALYARYASSPAQAPATPEPASALSVTAAPVALNAAGGVALTVGSSETLSVGAVDAPATATTSCGTGSVATLTGSPGATITLTATGPGTCAVTLTNSAGKSATIAITVSSPASVLPVTAAPTAIVGGALALRVGNAETLTIAAADGPATATSTCGVNGIATLSGSPGTTFDLTLHSAGTCAITLSNGSGKTTTIQIIVAAASPPATPNPTATPTPNPSGTATPTPSGTATPAPTPTPAPPNLTVAPTSLAFTSAGATAPLVVTETAYTGVLTESSTCAGIATVSPATGNGPSATFTVTAVASGACSVTITDSGGRTATAAIGVTTLGVIIQSKTRKP